jgi:transcriptional regulator with XRE-family HTH domain
MPRIDPERTLANERNLAKRVEYERDERGWSYAGLARRMSDQGLPMQKSTIFKIEQGNPPRRISLDEAIGFARIFNLKLDEMLMPMPQVLNRRAAELTRKYNRSLAALSDAVTELIALHVELLTLGRSGDDRDRTIFERSVEWLPRMMITYPMGDEDDPKTPDPIGMAWDALARGVDEYARWFVESNERDGKGLSHGKH